MDIHTHTNSLGIRYPRVKFQICPKSVWILTLNPKFIPNPNRLNRSYQVPINWGSTKSTKVVIPNQLYILPSVNN